MSSRSPDEFKSKKEQDPQGDLGTDLLESADRASFAARENEELLKHVQALMESGRLSQAKSLAFSILRSDVDNVAIKAVLKEISKRELEQSATSPNSTKLRSSEMIKESALAALESELKLSFAHDCFGEPEDIRQIVLHCESQLEGASEQDRLDMGIAYFEMGFYKVSQSVLSPMKNQPYVVNVLAQIHMARGQIFEADQLLSGALPQMEMDNQCRAAGYYLLGRLKESRKLISEAVQCYTNTNENVPSFRDAGERLAKLRGQLE